MPTMCIINCWGLCYSENPSDFPKVRFPFAKLVARDSQLNHTPTVSININQFIMKKNTILLLLLFTFNLTFGQKIFKALKKQDYKKLEQLLKKGEKPEQFNEKGLTPLWVAVFKNDTTAVKVLLNHKAEVNFLSKNGMPSIMVGCIANAYESVNILLENKANVNWKSKNSRNQQPIRFASQGGSLPLVKLLLKYGADMESTPDDKGTPLITSLHAKKFEIAEFFFKNGANVNIVGRDGECVIHEAIKTENPEMVKLALKYNAPLDLKDAQGITTWEIAKQSNNSEIKNLIKEALK